MTREDLKVYKYDKEFIKDKLEYIQEQKYTLYKITTTLTGMPIGSKKAEDTMAEKLVSLMDLLNQLLDKIKKMQEKQVNIEEQLLKLEQPYRSILDKVYIQGKTLIQVADELNYSYVHICREHITALNKFDEIMI